MAKRVRFKSEKRRKEVKRQKKQEEKRQRRLGKGIEPKEAGEAPEPQTETPGDTPAAE